MTPCACFNMWRGMTLGTFETNHSGLCHNLSENEMIKLLVSKWLAHKARGKMLSKVISRSPTSSCAAESSPARLASASPAKGLRRVWRKSAAFLFLSACSCFSLDSFDAWASFSRAAAARRSSSFCLAKGGEGGTSRWEMVLVGFYRSQILL